ncbi:MAG: lysophospholipid acyltransferase family protein [Candidatus Omnitrophica bacterium]|nr:lysophospholipid acyltransferase family protein [Candidatus Omnitrophota bacterium]
MGLSLAFRIASWIVLRLPQKTAYRLARKVGLLYSKIQRRERNWIQENLQQILQRPLAKRESKALIQEVYIQFAKYLVDFFRIPRINQAFIENHVVLNGLERVRRVLVHGKGGILLTAHLGSWELGGAVLGSLGFELEAIALAHRDQGVDEFFVKQRLSKRVRSIPLSSALKGAIQGLRENHLIAIVGDRDYTQQGVPIQFLGKLVSFPRGTAYLSLKTGAPIIPVFIIRQEDDKINMTIDEPLVCEKFTGCNDDAVKELTQKCAQKLEERIRQHPTQWLVFRKFWEPMS